VRNTITHAGAHSLAIAVSDRDGRVELRVDDDGIGIDADQVAADGHVGLRLLGELAADAHGTLTVARRPDGGTTLTLELPTS
jgi:NarL family two-component system sensor histidine kinase LiaS